MQEFLRQQNFPHLNMEPPKVSYKDYNLFEKWFYGFRATSVEPRRCTSLNTVVTNSRVLDFLENSKNHRVPETNHKSILAIIWAPALCGS